MFRFTAAVSLTALCCMLLATGQRNQKAESLTSLYVGSYDPTSGVQIRSTLADYYGRNCGTTSFHLAFPSGSTTTLIAPDNTGTTLFSHWDLDGVAQPVRLLSVEVPLNGPVRTAVAVYEPWPR